jgi:hypothetical protein
MTLLSLSRRTALLLVAVSSLLGLACASESAAPTYAPTDIEGDAVTAIDVPASTGCVTGETRACKVYLGRHGDLTNCVDGTDVCSAGEWTGCIDEASLAENPELVSQLTAR